MQASAWLQATLAVVAFPDLACRIRASEIGNPLTRQVPRLRKGRAGEEALVQAAYPVFLLVCLART